MLEEVLAKASALGVRALRTNGHNDALSKVGDTAIQVAPLEYDEVALVGLDWVLSRARFHGVRLVLTLGNYWDAYGGARQYVEWAGLPGPWKGMLGSSPTRWWWRTSRRMWRGCSTG